jgi:segregation and condensation protein B
MSASGPAEAKNPTNDVATPPEARPVLESESPAGAAVADGAMTGGATDGGATEGGENLSLLAGLEALLFVAPGAVTSAQLAAALQQPLPEIEQGLASLEALYAGEGPHRGLRLQRYRGRVQLTAAPQAGAAVERFLGVDSGSRLSRAALETLAIVLYRQPVTRPQIDAIRGVNSDGVLKSLLLRGLVQEVGRAEAAGRPILYSATPECLQYFGLSSLDDLPPLKLEAVAGDEPDASVAHEILK